MYGKFTAVKGVSLGFAANRVHALIGPSGCGKSTFLRTLNRMHELSEHGWITGRVLLDGEDIYAPRVNAMQLRRRIGMVFQRPTPFPTMSIYDNVAAGPAGARPAAQGGARCGRRAVAPAGGPLGRGEGPASRQRDGAVGRAAAAALHRADHRAVAGRGPARRAHRVARSPGHPADRGAALRAQAGVHHHHRDPQHAAGGPGVRHHDLLLPRHDGRDRATPGRSSRRRGTSRPRPTSPGGSDDQHRPRTSAAGLRPTSRAPRWRRGRRRRRRSSAAPRRWTSATSASPTAAGRSSANLTLRDRAEGGHGDHRPVGLRQVHLPPVDQPAQRPDPRHPPRGRHPGRRHVGLLAEHRPRGAAAAGRHGVPAAQSVPQVGLRQRGVRPGAQPARARGAICPTWWSGACARRRCGTR